MAQNKPVTKARGFILQAGYRVGSRSNGQRVPVTHIYGRLEADVRFAVRYLVERGIKGGCEIEGEAVAGTGVTWVFDNPSLRPADVTVEPRVLSFDIETTL